MHKTALFTLFLTMAACTGTAQPTIEVGDAGTTPDCVKCHMPDYLEVKHPPHKDVKPTTCFICHKQESWRPQVLDHPWALTGKHEKTDCFQCHKAKPAVFRGLGSKCVDCHKAEYDKPPFPDHMLFQVACQECHTTTDWKTLVPNPIWPPHPDYNDAGAALAEDAGAEHDAGVDGGKAKPKPKPKPPKPDPTNKPPDVTTGGSRHGR